MGLLSDPSERFNKSSNVFDISPSAYSSKFACILKQSGEFLEVEVSLQSLGGNVGYREDIFASVSI